MEFLAFHLLSLRSRVGRLVLGLLLGGVGLPAAFAAEMRGESLSLVSTAVSPTTSSPTSAKAMRREVSSGLGRSSMIPAIHYKISNPDINLDVYVTQFELSGSNSNSNSNVSIENGESSDPLPLIEALIRDEELGQFSWAVEIRSPERALSHEVSTQGSGKNRNLMERVRSKVKSWGFQTRHTMRLKVDQAVQLHRRLDGGEHPIMGTLIRFVANGAMMGTVFYYGEDLMGTAGSYAMGFAIASFSGLVHYYNKSIFRWITQSGAVSEFISGQNRDRFRSSPEIAKGIEEHLRWIFMEFGFVGLAKLTMVAFGVTFDEPLGVQALKLAGATLLAYSTQAGWDLYITKTRARKNLSHPEREQLHDFVASNQFVLTSVMANAISTLSLVAGDGSYLPYVVGGVMGSAGFWALYKSSIKGSGLFARCEKTLGRLSPQ